jgi:hypothetical protein
MTDTKKVEDVERDEVIPLPPPRTPAFVSNTGNPENGYYLDWFEYCKNGQVVPFVGSSQK